MITGEGPLLDNVLSEKEGEAVESASEISVSKEMESYES